VTAKILTLAPVAIVPAVINAARLIVYDAPATSLLASTLQLLLARSAWLNTLRADQISLVAHALTPIRIASRRSPKIALSGRYEADDVPEGHSLRFVPRTSRVSASGVRAEGSGQSLSAGRPNKMTPLVAVSVRLVHGQPSPPPAAGMLRPNVYVQIGPEDSLRRLEGAVASVGADLEVRPTSHRVLGLLPLTAGGSVRTDQLQLTITRVDRNRLGYVITLRDVRFPSLIPRVRPEISAAIYDPSTRIWNQLSYSQRGPTDAATGFGFYTGEAPWAGAWQSAAEIFVRTPPTPEPEDWARGVRLALVESIYSGRISRAWTDPRVSIGKETPRP
jgi:hypothetical protein